MRYWLPPALWAAIILAASSDAFSAAHTGGLLQLLITKILGRPLPGTMFDQLHFLIRKTAHLTEYGIEGGLLFRALRGGRDAVRCQWVVTAIALAACLASVDEFRQSFVPSRTGTPVDVVIDTIGAAIVVTAWSAAARRRVILRS